MAEERGTTVDRGVRAGHTERVVFEQKCEGGKEVRCEDIWGRAFLTEGRARRETLRWEVACGAEEQRGGQWDWKQGSKRENVRIRREVSPTNPAGWLRPHGLALTLSGTKIHCSALNREVNQVLTGSPWLLY